MKIADKLYVWNLELERKLLLDALRPSRADIVARIEKNWFQCFGNDLFTVLLEYIRPDVMSLLSFRQTCKRHQEIMELYIDSKYGTNTMKEVLQMSKHAGNLKNWLTSVMFNVYMYKSKTFFGRIKRKSETIYFYTDRLKEELIPVRCNGIMMGFMDGYMLVFSQNDQSPIQTCRIGVSIFESNLFHLVWNRNQDNMTMVINNGYKFIHQPDEQIIYYNEKDEVKIASPPFFRLSSLGYMYQRWEQKD